MTGSREKVDNEASKVELTLMSIHGVTWDIGENEASPPTATVSVAFSGSASTMEISTSTMCGRTGYLVVESNPVRVGQPAKGKNEELNSECKLFASFKDPTVRGRLGSATDCPRSALSQSNTPPHMRLWLLNSTSGLPAVPLESLNRDSRIIRNMSSFVESESGISSFHPDKATNESDEEVEKLWDVSAMPEIVEMHVSLTSEDKKIHDDGIAHLVLFGSHEENGLVTLDLRIKKKNPVNPGSLQKNLSFGPDAYIRVQLRISSSETSDDLAEDAKLDEELQGEQMDDIMRDLREIQELDLKRERAEKFAAQAKEKKRNASKPFMCSGSNSFGQSIRDFFRIAFWKCQEEDDEYDHYDPYLLPMASTMESSLETRDSIFD